MINYIPLEQWQAPAVPIEPPFAHLDAIEWLPLAEGELLLSAHYFPIVMRLDGPEPAVGALVRRNMLFRALIGTNGAWSGAYTPIALRCFPFRLAATATEDPLAELQIAGIRPNQAAKPRILRLKDDAGAPTKDLLAIHDGLKSIRDGQRKLRNAMDLLMVADLLQPVSAPNGSGTAPPYYTVDRRKFAQSSKWSLEAMTRNSFSPLDLLTVLTFSQSHLAADVRPAAVPAAATGDGAAAGISAAEIALSTGLETVTPWLDTSELFPGTWAADPAIWAAQPAPAGKEPQPVSAPASQPPSG